MATIRPNDNAPAEDVKYILPTVTFDLGADGTFETDDRSALSAAEVHPWLTVEYPAVEEVAVTRLSGSVPPTEDHLSALYEGADANAAFDPQKVEEAEAAKVEILTQPLALDAGLKQTDAVESGGVAETLAVERDTELTPLAPVNDEKPAKGKKKE